MGLYQRYATDKALEQDGVWVEMLDGVAFRIISDQNPKIRELKRRQMKKHRQYFLNMDVPAHIEDDMNIETAVALVNGWRGPITDADGQPMAFTPENVKRVMTDLREVRQNILFAAGTAETFRAAEVEAMAKNSETPSTPS
jgi:hypothetical protein